MYGEEDEDTDFGGGGGDGWLDTGFGGIKEEENRLASARGPRRFFLKKGERKQLVFVDGGSGTGAPACIHEFNPKLNGSWTNWFTSPKSDPNYPDLDTAMTIINKHLGGKYRDYYVGYFTVVDCSEWKDRTGNKHRFEMKLLPAKIKSLKLLQSRMEDFGGLAGKAINVRRTDDVKSPSIGDVFDFDRDVEMEKLWDHVMYQGKLLKEHFAEAVENDDKRAWLTRTFRFKRGEGGMLIPAVPQFNYMELLKPKTPAELREFLSGSTVETPDGSNDKAGAGDGAADEDVPF